MDLSAALETLPTNATMRDIFDFCVKHNLHNLAQGMIELPPPLKLRQRAVEYCLHQDHVHQYRARYGENVYRSALAGLLQRHYGLCSDVTKDCILATSGVSGGIFSTLMLLKERHKGRTVRIGLLEPFYTYHLKQIQTVFGYDPVFIPSNDDFSPNFDNIEKQLESGLDLFIFCNPGNPQGNVWSKADVQKIVSLTASRGCLLLIDEVYCDLVWRGDFFTPFKERLYDHIIVVRGFAKTLGAQSWRVGYLISTPGNVDELMRLHDPVYISVSWQQHAIGDYLVEDYDDFVAHVAELGRLMQDNWSKLSAALRDKLGWEPIAPDGSMYGMFRHGQASDRDAVVQALRHGVGVAPGSIFFGGSKSNTKYTRIHVGIAAEKCDEIVRVIQSSN